MTSEPLPNIENFHELLKELSEREDAAFFTIDSLTQLSAREDVAVLDSLKKDGNLKPIKEKLKESRKPKLRTVEQYLCDSWVCGSWKHLCCRS